MPAPPIRRRNRHGRAVHGQISLPWRFLLGDQFDSSLVFIDWTGIHDPNDRTARLLLFALYADHVAYLQFALHSRDQRTFGTDILRARRLRKRASIGAHAPNTHRKVDRKARFGLMFSHATSSCRMMR